MFQEDHAYPNWDHIAHHYHRYWGYPKKILRFRPEFCPGIEGRLLVYVYTPKKYSSTWIYATAGMSREAMVSGNRAELYLYAMKEDDELAELLFNLAEYPFALKTFFAAGHLIAGPAKGGVTVDSKLSEIVLFPGGYEEISFMMTHDDDENQIDLLWVVPISKSERALAKRDGWLKLLKIFADQHVDLANLQRPSL